MKSKASATLIISIISLAALTTMVFLITATPQQPSIQQTINIVCNDDECTTISDGGQQRLNCSILMHNDTTVILCDQ